MNFKIVIQLIEDEYTYYVYRQEIRDDALWTSRHALNDKFPVFETEEGALQAAKCFARNQRRILDSTSSVSDPTSVVLYEV